MRNVVRNILTNWRNVFGKKTSIFPPGTGLPYTFNTPVSQIDFTMYSGHNVPFDFEISYIHNGTSQGAYGTETTPLHGFGSTFYTDIGTPCTFSAQSGDCSYLEINGVIIFDNR